MCLQTNHLPNFQNQGNKNWPVEQRSKPEGFSIPKSNDPELISANLGRSQLIGLRKVSWGVLGEDFGTINEVIRAAVEPFSGNERSTNIPHKYNA